MTMFLYIIHYYIWHILSPGSPGHMTLHNPVHSLCTVWQLCLDHHVFFFTCHPEVQLLHDDVVLEVRVPPEVKTDPVAEFIILERLDLKETWGKCLNYATKHIQPEPDFVHTHNSSYLKISHVTKSIFISLVNVSWEMRMVQQLAHQS